LFSTILTAIKEVVTEHNKVKTPTKKEIRIAEQKKNAAAGIFTSSR